MKHKWKLLFTVILGLAVMSCQNEDFDAITDSKEITPNLRQAGDGKYDLLGFSYDITGEYLHVDEARRSVIDMEAFIKVNPTKFYDPTTTVGNINYYSGAIATDFLEDIVKKTSSKGGLSVLGGLFSGSISKSKEFQTKYSFSSKYSFSRGDVIKRVKRLYVNSDIEELIKYLNPTFKEDLYKLSADQFVKDYGTHVMTDITIGGRLSFIYRSAITEETNYTRKKEISEAGLKFNIGKFGADGNKSHDSEVIKQLNSKNASWSTQINYYGGEGSGLSLTYNSETGYPTTTFNLDSWERSVNSKNAALVDINWEKAYPIYDLITDPVKKTQIKDAVIRYIKSKQIEVLELTPLYRVHNHHSHNSFTVLGQPELQFWLRKGSHYEYDGHIGYVPNRPLVNTTPLYRVHNHSSSNSFTVLGQQELQFWLRKGSHYEYDGQTGYVYTKQEPNTVPLYRVHNHNSSNSFTVLGQQELQFWLRMGSHYEYDGQTGYVYPN